MDRFLDVDDDVLVVSKKPLLDLKNAKPRKFLPIEENDLIVVSKKPSIHLGSRRPKQDQFTMDESVPSSTVEVTMAEANQEEEEDHANTGNRPDRNHRGGTGKNDQHARHAMLSPITTAESEIFWMGERDNNYEERNSRIDSDKQPVNWNHREQKHSEQRLSPSMTQVDTTNNVVPLESHVKSTSEVSCLHVNPIPSLSPNEPRNLGLIDSETKENKQDFLMGAMGISKDLPKWAEHDSLQQLHHMQVSDKTRLVTTTPIIGAETTVSVPLVSERNTGKSSSELLTLLALPDEDDIVIVQKKPIIQLGKNKKNGEAQTSGLYLPVATQRMTFICCILLIIAYAIRQRKKLKLQDDATKVFVSSFTTSNKPHTPRPKAVEKSNPQIGAIDETSPPDTQQNIQSLELKDQINTVSTSSGSGLNSSQRIPELMSVQPNSPSSSHSPQQANQNESISTDLASTSQDQEKDVILQTTAKKVANDIRLIQEVFRENGLEESLASQLALTIHSFRELTLAQKEIKSCALIMESQQELLMRQVEAANCYDPNWKDKLRDRRDQCWNIAYRLIWDVAVAHILVKATRSVIPLVFMDGQYGSWTSASRLVQLLLSNICNCNVSGVTVQSSGGFSWLIYSIWSNDIFLQSWGWDSSIILGQGVCYGYCVLSLIVVSMITLVAHQMLRAFSSPILLHHAINSLAIAVLYGGPAPMDWIRHMRTDLIVLATTSLVGMLTVVEWKYLFHRKQLGNCLPDKFRTIWEQSLDAMDTLKFQISVTRCIALVISGSILWFQLTDDANIGITSEALHNHITTSDKW